EFVGKYLQVQGVAQSHSIDAAINFVIKSFSDSDINMTPLLVGLYLRVFCRSAQKISGVSFLELLQELETYGFSKVRNSLTNTRYYFKRFLMRLAISCYRARTLSVELVPLKDEFSDLFLKAAIPDDVASLLEALQETGIVAISDSKISFSCFVFFWYYLAQAFNEDNELLKDALSNDVSLIVAGGAIAYYAGEKRDNLNIISELLAAMKRRRPTLLNVTLADFEKYANKFLLPPDEPDADAQVEELSRKSNSAVLSEEEFASEKEIMRKTTERFFRYMPGKTVFSDFDADAQILKTIYNSFRNLEVIPAADKEYILDLTLNYHLDSNFRIIKFLAEMVRGEGEHVSSFVAYVVAIAGATLLSDNIASEQLCTTLERVYEKTASPLKRFLIICIMQELGMEDISDRLVELLKETRSFPLTELGYFVLRYDLIMYDKKRIPDRLRLAFKEVCAMRNRARGVHEYQRINSDFNAEWNQVETLRLGNVKDRIVNG
ncbi:MAG: hypothetical protein Q4A15_10925, partial [Prevotellaceae bacterium]|nr:hypothetical protein [Prevotellaceae bacterium]